MSEEFGLFNEDGIAIALRGVEVSARIVGLVAETTLSQRYRNDGDENIEVTYTFPLPTEGVLLSFEAELGQKKYQGTVMPRRSAEADYEKALEQGNSAFRLQKVREGIYSATLGNILPGEELVIRLRYGEPLRWQAGRMRYRIPTAIAPRYGQPTGMQPWQRPVAALNAEYPFALQVHVCGDLARAGFECATHRIAFAVGNDCTTLTLQGAAWLDRDFVLAIQTGEVRSMAVAARSTEGHIGLVSLMPPAVKESTATGRDYVIVLDCSGSMAGDSIRHAKEGVRLALSSLTAEDRFAVVGFGSHTQSFDHELQPANRKNLTLAEHFVNQLPDLGGTELAAAMTEAMQYANTQPLNLLLLTDGECWNVGDITRIAKTHGHRIFSIGIGSAVAEDMVKNLAQETGGACELLTPNEDMAARIAAHFERMRQPALESVTLDWGQLPVWAIAPPSSGLFAGDSCLAWAALSSEADNVNVRVTLKNGPEFTDTLVYQPAASMDDTLVRLAAHARLATLPAAERQDWAVRHQLVTNDTDYLITVERTAADKANTLPELHVVPQMLAAGWGGTGMVHYDLSMSDALAPRASMKRPDTSGLMASAPSVYSMSIGELETVYSMPTTRRSARRHAVAHNIDVWAQFFEQLEARIAISSVAGLPRNLNALGQLLAQADVINALYELVRLGANEAQVVRSAIDLISEFTGVPIPPNVSAILDKLAVPDEALVDQVRAAFEVLPPGLWAKRDAVAPSLLDIPAFLMKQSE